MVYQQKLQAGEELLQQIMEFFDCIKENQEGNKCGMSCAEL
jgi:hypothetical protein